MVPKSGLFRFRGYIYYEKKVLRMRKIHISEEQLNELRSKLAETYTVDVTADLEAGKTPQQVVATKKAENPNLGNDANSGEATFGFNPNGIDESKTITKRQIKEAKIANLRKNSIRFSKRDIN